MAETDKRSKYARLGAYLRGLRGHLTLQEVADQSGIPPYQISRIELGSVKPTFEDLVKLGKFYRVSPNDLAHHLGVWPLVDTGVTDPLSVHIAQSAERLPSNARRKLAEFLEAVTA